MVLACLDLKGLNNKMNNIKVEKMNIKDMKQATDLLQKEWNLGKRESEATRNICAWIYLMEILEETEEMFLYKEDGKLIGFAGYSNIHSKKHYLKKKCFSIIKDFLCHSRKIKNKEGFRAYRENYDYIPEQFKRGYFDGEVSILILDEVYRGKGLGKNLLSDVFSAAKRDGMRNIQILTDESCNVQFYEKMGCKKVYETVVENKEQGLLGDTYSEKAYIYEKKLS